MEMKYMIAIGIAVLLVGGGAIGGIFLLGGDDDSEPTYTVTYNVNGGDVIEAKTFTEGTDTFTLPTPSKTSSTFLGWYSNAELTGDPVTQVAKGTKTDLQVWAKWQFDAVSMPTASQIASNDIIRVVLDPESDGILAQDAIDAITEDHVISVVSMDGDRMVSTWVIDGSSPVAPAGGIAPQSEDGIDVIIDEDRSTVSEGREMGIHFSHSGPLPYHATITYFVGDVGDNEGFDPGTVLEILDSEGESIGQTVVNAGGYIDFIIDACDDYTLVQCYAVNMHLHGGAPSVTAAGWEFTDHGYVKYFPVGTSTAIAVDDFMSPDGVELLRTGYIFSDWTFTVDIVGDEGVSVNAEWDPITYTVQFDNNGGTGEMESVGPYEYGQSFVLEHTTFTKDGKAFNGWSTTADGTMHYMDGATVSNLATEQGAVVTLYAVWGPSNISVGVSVDGVLNEGFNLSVRQGDSTPTPLVYETSTMLYRCFEISDGTYDLLRDGVDTGKDIVVTNGLGSAQMVFYTVTFNLNGGTGGVPAQVVLKNGFAMLPTVVPTRTGYEFDSWVRSGEAWDFEVDEITDTTTISAKWNAKTYTVSFDVKGGSAMDPVTVTYGQYPGYIDSIPTKDGHDIVGFDYVVAGSDPVRYFSYNRDLGKLTPSMEWDIDADVTLVAEWEVKKYDVFIDVDGGDAYEGEGWEYSYTDGAYVKRFEFGVSYADVIADFGSTPEKDGHQFVEWSYTGTSVQASDETNIITATYALIDYRIVFNLNGGTGSAPAEVSDVTVEDTVQEPEYNGTRAGYTFVGWSFDEFGISDAFNDSGEMYWSYATLYEEDDYSIIVYAAWEKVTYSLQYDLNGGTGTAIEGISEVRIENYINLPTPDATKAEKFYGGWNTASDGTGQNYIGRVQVDTAMVSAASGTVITLYIEWTDGVYTATVGDVIEGTVSAMGATGDWKYVIIRANSIEYDAEMLFFEDGKWVSDGYETFMQGHYPDIGGKSILDAVQGLPEPPQISTSSGTVSVKVNGVSSNVNVTVYQFSYNGTNTVKIDAFGTCYYYKNVGNYTAEWSMEDFTIGANNGYDFDKTYSVKYIDASSDDDVPYVTKVSSKYLSADDVGFTAPSGKVFGGWNYFGSDGSSYYGYKFEEGDIITTDRTVYAKWVDRPETNIEWTITNHLSGIGFLIGEENALELNGEDGDVIVVTGGTDWSYSDGLFTFKLDGKTYHAMLDREDYADYNAEDPLYSVEAVSDGGRMNIELLNMVEFNYSMSTKYVVEIVFYQDLPNMPGYLFNEGDSFTYLVDDQYYNEEQTLTVLGGDEYYNDEYRYSDSLDPGYEMYAQLGLYPKDPIMEGSYGLMSYIYSIETITVAGASVECYVISYTVSDGYTRSISEKYWYGVADGLYYKSTESSDSYYYSSTRTEELTSKSVSGSVIQMYDVTFDANGGTFSGDFPGDATSFTAKAYGTHLVLIDDYFVTLGDYYIYFTYHDFLGWSTDRTASAAMYGEEDFFRASDATDGAITLYAIWAFDGGYVRIDGNGGTLDGHSVHTVDVSTGSSYALTINKSKSYDFRKDGKVLVGFEFNGVVYNTCSSDSNQIKIYVLNSLSSTQQGYPTLESNDYPGVHYYADESLASYGYRILSIYTTPGNTVPLKAVYADPVTLKFNLNGGTGEVEDMVVPVSSADVSLPYQAALYDRAPEGMAFAGWALTADGDAELDGDSIETRRYFNHGSSKTEVTLYAMWTEA